MIATMSLAIGACQFGAKPADDGVSADVVRERLGQALPRTQVKSVSKTAVTGVYEVVAGQNVFYTDADARYMFVGALYDIANRRDVTADRVAEVNRIEFAALPKDAAIVIRQGSGKNTVAVFSDPDCPFCRKLEPELAKLKDTTIYVYMMPLPMHTDAARKAESVWCSNDRATSWRDMMLANKNPVAGEHCTAPMERVLSIAKGYGITGTPALVSLDGRKHLGFMPAEKIELWLANKDGGKS